MSPSATHATALGAVVALTWATPVKAQGVPTTPATATHQHYAEAPQASQPGPNGELAPRLQNLGPHTFRVRTKRPDAQRFMNQGLNLAYAFNHAEARRAFREAARLDPSLAMAYWGQALVLGPNINAAMEPNEEPHAYELVQKAVALRGTASARERALIDALAKRYSGSADRRTANDKAYADAMRAVHTSYPADPDIAMLYVESMMDLRPWGYWMPDGRPHEGTAEIVALTEDVLRRHPRHPAALHMYIHLVEATSTPERAEKAADTLLTLMPAAGHMVHMPSHIYQRVGRYADAIKSNDMAVAADEDYIAQCRAQGLYPMAYYPHNIHFRWFGAMFDGQQAVAIDSAKKVAGKIDDNTLTSLPLTAAFRVVPYWTYLRFGRWEDILREPAPPVSNPFLTGAWRYARGQAFVATNRLAEAERELETLKPLLSDPSLDRPLFSPNTARAILSVGTPLLAGEIAAAKGEIGQALAHLEQAVRLEDALVYTEPSEWAFPPRHVLGAVLLEAGRAAEAEVVYWEDLKRNRENPWALAGVARALQAQNKSDQAAIVETRLRAAVARADLEIPGSRFGRSASPRLAVAVPPG
jgi:tetratricopeptide (TPR) repeat protein